MNQSTRRTCAGCGAEIVPGPRERNKRRWCSESCRLRKFRDANPDYVKRNRQSSSEWQRANYVPVRYDLVCTVCRDTFVSANPHAKYCSNPCRYRAAYVGRRGRRAGAERERYALREIADRDGWVCGICGDAVDGLLSYPDPLAASIDHVVPLALGGADTPANVQVAHLSCNRRKGHRVPELAVL